MTTGIHHITAIASDGAATVHFYSKILGLRLVKKTVNQDDVATYHLFFGDRLGHPGMDLTFFIFKPSTQGERGVGAVTKISLAVPAASLDFWQKRLATFGVKHDPLHERFGLQRIVFFDHDDQQLELVGVPDAELETKDIWTTDDVSAQQAVRHFHSATLSVAQLTRIDQTLQLAFGYQFVKKDGTISLYTLENSQRAFFLEVSEEPDADAVYNAAGTVHHIAFRAANEREQHKLAAKVVALGLHPTAPIDRFYFTSVYFRTHDGILFEIATDEPGFVADESEETLGQKLALPPFLEPHRLQIEAGLPPLSSE